MEFGLQKSSKYTTEMMELEALQLETKLLLESIKKKSKPTKNTVVVKSNANPKAKSNKKRRQLETSIELSKTTQLYSLENRKTVEILDDASPDNTPRIDESKQKNSSNFQNKSVDETSENTYRKMLFNDEKSRVQSGTDTFVPNSQLSIKDVEVERKRLQKIEESAKRKNAHLANEVYSQKNYIQQDKAALKFQSLFRGHIGRQKYNLTQKLNDFISKSSNNNNLNKKKSKEDVSDWIEVKDGKTGDIWYYNKVTNISQWDKPSALSDSNGSPSKLKLKQMMTSSELDSSTMNANAKTKVLSVSMSMPSLDVVEKNRGLPNNYINKTLSYDPRDGDVDHEDNKIQKELSEDRSAQEQVNDILGISKVTQEDSLMAPDGTFKPQLRTTVLDALLSTRFDSVSSVLADSRWIDNNDPPFAKDTLEKLRKEEIEATAPPNIDLSREPLVSMLTFNNKKKKKRQKPIDVENMPMSVSNKEGLEEAKELTINQLQHAGFENENGNNSSINDMMCFGCWSSGMNKKCTIHQSSEKEKMRISQTMLLCRNWELDVMRRRYRAEEIQELFFSKETSLRYSSKFKRFFTVIEKKHPIYRSLSSNLEKCNNIFALFVKVKRWINSFVDVVKTGEISEELISSKAQFNILQDKSKILKLKNALINHSKVNNFSKFSHDRFLSVYPITGYTWKERIGDVQYLFKHIDYSTRLEVDLIQSYPTPVPKHLYELRVYHISVPKSIPMPQPTYANEAKVEELLLGNAYIDESHPLSWFERYATALSRDSISAAQIQIRAITPMTGIDLLEKTKRPLPVTIKFATLGQKPCPGNLALGGLALELLITQLVTTQMSVQYGSLMVMDKSIISPGISPEITISFQSISMPPIIQDYVIRPLEHPLNYRRAPTITLNSSVLASDLSYYGTNRPEQTGEQESHGFRTTGWAPMLLTYDETDPQTFTPGLGVVSLNDTKANNPCTSQADMTYPFCEPSTRDNSTLDFYHMLLTGVVSISKPQIFTALTIQEPGEFLKKYRTDVPMGHVVASIYRSWAFRQKESIQEFKSNDGVSYWYYRRTGQTFWERPLFDEEEVSPLNGGTQLDMIHPEEPTMMNKGEEGASRRLLQGEFRSIMLNRHEDKNDAIKRRKSAQSTLLTAKQKGIVPDLAAQASIANNPNQSQELGSHFDFSKGNNMSIMVNSEFSGGEAQSYVGNLPQVRDPHLVYNEDNNPIPVPIIRGSQLEDGSHLQHQNNVNQQMDEKSIQNSQQGLPLHNNNNHIPREIETPFQPLNSSHNIAQQGLMTQPTNFPGIDQDMIMNLTQTISRMFSTMMAGGDMSNPQNMISLGLGMGMALMQTATNVPNMLNSDENVNDDNLNNDYNKVEPFDYSQQQEGDFIPIVTEDMSTGLSVVSAGGRSGVSRDQSRQSNGGSNIGEPIGKPYATVEYASKGLNHQEEAEQKINAMNKSQHLTSLDKARNIKIATVTPDLAPPKHLTHYLPQNAEESVMEQVPLVVYPELSTLPANGKPAIYNINQPAGLGTSFVSADEAEQQLFLKRQFSNSNDSNGSAASPSSANNLRRTVMPLPVGFFGAIASKHIAKQSVDYLPQVPNLPQTRTIGRVKPRSAAADWLLISFDPWSAGKNPLGTEFVPSLMSKADKIIDTNKNAGKAADVIDGLRAAAVGGAFMSVEDEEGLAEQRAEITKAAQLAQDFKKLCSLCRHSKFSDAEELINQPDWNVPIDYQDEQGNTLLHVVSQNGNRRFVKLCLRRGAALNLQNLNGQTPLHFAYGYGYTEVGDYLVSKGADDSVRNKDGLTCYEGLGAKELAHL
eukprot:gene4402-6226_t